MAWTTPVSNRANAQTRTTATDMNRIAGNVNYLWGTSLKDDYTSNDIVTDTEWDGIVEASQEIAELVGTTAVTSDTTYSNFNAIEGAAEAYYAVNPLWLEDDLYPEEDLYPR